MNQLNFKTQELKELVELAEKRGDEFINFDDTLFCFGTSHENAGGGQFLAKLNPQMILQPGSYEKKFVIHDFQVSRTFPKGADSIEEG